MNNEDLLAPLQARKTQLDTEMKQVAQAAANQAAAPYLAAIGEVQRVIDMLTKTDEAQPAQPQ